MQINTKTVMSVEDLSINFNTDRGIIRAVEGVSFTVSKGEIWGLVGESASGKSVISQALVGIIAKPAGKVVSGRILFNGTDILKSSPKVLQKLRGNEIAFIPQDPTVALNPLLKIGFQVSEALKYHHHQNKTEIKRKVIDLMRVVNIPAPEERYNDYPHQLSGGLKQRIIIATALSCNPTLLVADEPTSALDVTIQMQIIKLIEEIQRKYQMTMILITHNLGLVARMCHKVAVLYCGQIVEEADVRDLFRKPIHPYTKGLLGSVPKGEKGEVCLYTIPGNLPNPLKQPKGCRFSPRCSYFTKKCKELPPIEPITEKHSVRCWRWKEM